MASRLALGLADPLEEDARHSVLAKPAHGAGRRRPGQAACRGRGEDLVGKPLLSMEHSCGRLIHGHLTRSTTQHVQAGYVGTNTGSFLLSPSSCSSVRAPPQSIVLPS